MKNRFTALLLIVLGISSASYSQAASNNMWQMVSMRSADSAVRPGIILAPDKYAQFTLDEPIMRTELARAPARATGSSAMLGAASIPVPLPSGEIIDLVVEETGIMEAKLAAKYPSIKVFAAYGTGQQPIYGHLDVTEQGFHAMFSTEQGVVMIDPRLDASGARTYISYYKHDYHPIDKTPMSCKVHGDIESSTNHPAMSAAPAAGFAARSGSQLTTYRLAVAATGEYTVFQGGTVPLALSAIVTTVNRVNSIYERDMAIHLQLVSNNNLIIYTNASTDPYSNTNSSELLSQNQTNLDTVIGSANYDIGHVFGTGGGGLAFLQVPCGSSKARGQTGSPQPIGDPFDIDFVAHEMGHQFGGKHTFNSTTSNCGGGNRNSSTAWEPGSGTTVMAYAGICGAENLQSNSDSLFHAGSINQIINFITTGGGATCGVRTETGNTAPVANAGADYTIPANTPFVLTGSTTDVNSGDALTYAWDEMDLGTASTATDMVDEGTRPLFRSFVPSSSPVRYFPKLDSIRNNVSDIGERLPTTNRSLKFRLTVRDQHGGVADDDVTLTVNNSAGPFYVTSPNGGESLQTTSTVTWNVANTNSAPVSCANVSISLSTNSGASFPLTLLASTPNTGDASVTFPGGSSSTARLKVQCANNIFFDISNNNFSYTSVGVNCSYALGSTSMSAAAAGLSGTVSVTTTSGCAWTAISNASFISVTSGASGTGSGSVGYTVAANTSTSSRSGAMTIGGQTFTVTQAGVSSSPGTWTALPGASPSRPSMALHNGTGKNQMVVRSASDQLWVGNFNAGGIFEGWNALAGASPSPVAQAWHPVLNKMFLVTRSASDQLYLGTFNSGGSFEGWNALPGASPSQVALAWHPLLNKMYMVVRAASNQLFLGTFNSAGDFEGWSALPGASPSPVALAWHSTLNKMYMVVRAVDDPLFLGTFSSTGAFEGWNALPGTSPSPVALAWHPTLNKMVMVARSANDQLWSSAFNSSGVFGSWSQLSGNTPTEPSLSAGQSILQLVVRSANNKLWSMLIE